ncbi:MAG TPA: glycosyltransferase family 9 protein [Blastocatellia bacterium]|nr:glycosyltransferase family 9 protein [Blastocatellia bacterium]
MYSGGNVAAPARILVLNLGPLSHAVFMLPALKALRERFPAAEVTVAATRMSCELLALTPFPSNMVAIERWEPGKLYLPWMAYRAVKFVHEIGSRSYDAIIDFHVSLGRSFVLWWLANRQRFPIGPPSGLWEILIRQLREKPNPHKHFVDRFLDQLKPLGIKATDRVPRLSTDPSSDVRAGEILKSKRVERGEILIGLDPFPEAGAPFRPSDFYADLARRLVNTFEVRPLLVGTRRTLSAVLSRFPRQTLALRLNALSEIVSVLARLTLMISEDSAYGHIAAALGVPTIMIGCPITRKPLGEQHQFINPFGSPTVTVGDIFSMAVEMLRHMRTTALFER